MKLVVIAAGPFAVPMLRALHASSHEIAHVVCRPHRGRRSDPPLPVAACAEELGLPLWRPETINASDALECLAGLGADLLVVCDYGEILKPGVLEAARLGGVNLHGSLLPRYRGAAPVQHAVWNGDAEAGVAVITMTRGLDSGPIHGVARLAVDPDETAGELEARIAQLGAPLMVEMVDRLEAGTATPVAQDKSLATKAPRLSKEDGQIDWSRTALRVKNQVRAMQPWPRTYATWRAAGGDPVRLNIDRVSLVAEASGAPGEVLEAGDRLVVACGQGGVSLESVQAPGKRRLTAAEFLRGASLRAGDRFEVPSDPLETRQ
ncbi:Methionyl-tRNA formyltransferase [Pirellulimonas nuda]|uniref:Methionyl-tRNA formyltransferase n=1 Tax=Pirellulimonas nuda TaxID=2528009 RepID=A0A518D6S4_9BACT|nr:methionyl-tRNA formyltransferase [Pirellulimonas nuda]QDU87184.1 Methionyl-tRNA formyltransferase [Pirellulimonas nuda]